MKATKIIALLCFGACLFASCHHEEGPSKDDVEKMKETVQEWATYLSDNYQLFDSVYFLRTDLETQETQIEGFVVVGSGFEELSYEEAKGFMGHLHEEDDSYFSIYIDGYMTAVSLISREGREPKSSIGVDLHTSYDTDANRIQEYCYLYIQLGLNYDPCYDVGHFTTDKDLLTVTKCSNVCTMQRNVGIIRFSNDQYSWELVEKN